MRHRLDGVECDTIGSEGQVRSSMHINKLFHKPLVVTLIALGLVLSACNAKPTKTVALSPAIPATAPAHVTPKPAVDRTSYPVIVAFGDSLTAGLGVTFERNYPSQLQQALDGAGLKYRVVNAGISGDTTAGGLVRLDSVIKQKPRLVILELGANDALRGQPVAVMKQNLIQIIEGLRQEKIQVVLAGMEIPPNYGPEYTAAFEQTFRDLASTYKLPLIPFFLDGVGGKPELNQVDGIHPTAEGYVFVVKNVMTVLQPLLKP
jgi:acyl-CoA thioesterase-1